MGKLYLCVIILLLSLSAAAQRIDRQEAENVATSVLSKNCKPVLNTVSRSSSSDGLKQSTAFYAYNATDGEGFVIVGGDKRLPRILGYSDSGSFDYNNIPPQLSYLLSHLQERVDSMPLVTDKSWNSPRAEIKPEVLLPTAEWGQGAPYNEYCPTINGEKALTGCGATALAILMKYHSFPERGIGEWAYERNGVKASFDYENTPFEWDKMPMQDKSTFTKEEVDALATIMYAAGVSMGAEYGITGTGTTVGDEPNALSFVFGYSPDCQYIYKHDFSDDEFRQLTCDQLNQNLPVLYDGDALGKGSHVWVVDGYSENGTLFHCNWGWIGSMNGYYALNELMTGRRVYGMTINIRPSTTDEDPLAPKGSSLLYINSNYIDGIVISKENAKPHEPFTLVSRGFKCRPIRSKSEKEDSNIMVECIGLVDKDGNIKEILYGTKGHFGYNPWENTPYRLCFDHGGGIELVITSENIAQSDRIQLLYSYEDIGMRYNSHKKTLVIDHPEYLKPVHDYINIPASIPLSGNVPMESQKMRIVLDDNVTLTKMCKDISGVNEKEVLDNDIVIIPLNAGTTFYLKVKDSKKDYTLLGDIDGKLRGGSISRETGLDCDFFPESDEKYCFVPNITTKSEFTFTGKYVPVSKMNEITLTTPGALSTLIPVDEARTIAKLTIKGKIDARDIWYIAEEFRSLKSLDLRNTEICEVTMTELPWFESHIENVSLHSEAGKLPDVAFTEMYKLEELYLPNNIVSIGQNALCIINRLKQLELPASLSFIDYCTLRPASRSQLISITSLNPIPPEIGSKTFDGVHENHVILYVPDGSVEAYRNAPGWNKFEQILPLSSGIDSPETTESEDAAVIEVFNLQGVRIYSGLKIDMPQLPTGIYIQRDSKGTSKKIAIR